jgi:GT2 family glycosyltransferase
MSKVSCSIIIPTWNGEELLRKNLPKVLEVAPNEAEVIVIENGSEDGSREYLEELRVTGYELRVIENNVNLGFIGGCNQGVEKAKGDYVVLLNNDVVPERDFLAPALKHFNEDEVFAVSFNEVNSDGGWADIFWVDGFFNYSPGEKSDQAHISGWASGGSAVFRKSMWDELNGFDPMFDPFYWEDTDISYRAWKMGWKIIWEPEAKVVHEHESTISKIDQSYVNRVKERNQLLFIWKNITDDDLRFKHNLGLIQRVLTGPNYLKVIRDAKKRYRQFDCPKIDGYSRTDKEIFRLFDKV